MSLSTVKRESLIPRRHLLSIAALLVMSFIALLPSRETFTVGSSSIAEEEKFTDLDLAYLRARNTSGDLSDKEMLSIIHTMIRGQKWRQARSLIAQRPAIKIELKDQFLLDLQTASAGFYGATDEAKSASYKASLITLMNDLYVETILHDEDTLTMAANLSGDLGQPKLSARYYKLLASTDLVKDAEFYEKCARVLGQYNLYSEAVDCYNSSIASSEDEIQRVKTNIRLVRHHSYHGKSQAAESSLEDLVNGLPDDKRSLEQVATLALATEKPQLAHPIYATLARVESAKAVFWLEKATKWAEASSQPGIAAEYILNIRDLSDPKFTPDLNRRMQTLLIAAGRDEEALNTMFERIAAKPNSYDELVEGVALADYMGLTQQAMEWNEVIIGIRPFDTEALIRQVNYELASERNEEALAYGKIILEQDPLDPANHLRVAELEEWAGNTDNAMKQRQWLAKNNPTTANDQELQRLAELNWDSLIAAEALNRIGQRSALSTEDLQHLIFLYEEDGSPQLAAAALENLMDGSANDAMLLREVASLHTRHAKFEEALASWEQFANRFGRSPEESLNRMELLWGLKRPLEALAVTDQINQFNSNTASQRQLSLLSELGWRYRQPTLVYAAAPYLEKPEGKESINLNGRRLVQSFIDSNDYQQAVETAETLWRKSDEISFLLTAINIALQENIYPHYERYLDATGDLLAVRKVPEYWLTIAEYHNKNADKQAALETYRNTLKLHPDSTPAISGIIWTLLGENSDDASLLAILEEYESVATKKPELWNPYAVGYLRAKKPETSLRWFSKLMAKDDHDYNMLLSFADALEQTGNTNQAYKVRQYTLQELLPQVMASGGVDIDSASRDYISLLRSYGSVAENETWNNRLLKGVEHSSKEEGAWRRELATSWYLSTQRNDYARLVMTKRHERRLQTPLWQRLALALGDNNLPEIKEILANPASQLSSGDEILALRKLGQERKAWVLAKNTVKNPAIESDRDIARDHMLALRGSRPGYYSGNVTHRELGRLNVTETGLSLRHTLSAVDLGFEVDYHHNQLSSDSYAIENPAEDNIAVSAHFGNSKRGGQLTAGINSNGVDEVEYTQGSVYLRDRSGKRELTSEVSYNQVPESNPELRLGAKQNKAELAFQSTIRRKEFVRVSGNVNEMTARTTDERLAVGVDASIELGTTGSVGSNSWTMGVIASGAMNERTQTTLPESLALSTLSTYNSVLAAESQQLALSASLFRGGIRTDYPQAASPRYHVTARLGHNWPTETMALQVEAGAGFRLMGNDELSLQLAHDRSGLVYIEGPSTSTFGIQYTNHF